MSRASKRRNHIRNRKPSAPRAIGSGAPRKIVHEDRGAREINWGISAETIELAAARGDVITVSPLAPGEREKPPKKLSGLDWLWKKGNINNIQCAAGLKYGDNYRTANDISIRSGSNFTMTGGDGTSPIQVRLNAHQELEKVRLIALSSHTDMILICDEVCGEGRRVREIAKGDDRLADKIEAKLIVALQLLAAHYGMTPK